MRTLLVILMKRFRWTIAYLRDPASGPAWKSQHRVRVGLTGSLAATTLVWSLIAGAGALQVSGGVTCSPECTHS